MLKSLHLTITGPSLGRLILCVSWFGPRYLVKYHSRVCLWCCFQRRSTLESKDWAKTALHSVTGLHPLRRRPHKSTKAPKGEAIVSAGVLSWDVDLPPPSIWNLPQWFSWLLGLQTDRKHPTSLPGSPVCQPQIVGLFSLHNHASQCKPNPCTKSRGRVGWLGCVMVWG